MSEIAGIPPPDTHPEKLLGVPNPPPPPNPLPSPETLQSWLPLYLRKTDRVVDRLSKLLSTPAGTDVFLMCVGYGSLLSSTVLREVSVQRLRHAARRVVEKAITLPDNTTLLITPSTIPSTPLLLATRLAALSSLISDVRIFLRLWGLLAIYKWARATPPSDPVLASVDNTQVAVNVIYQVLENGAYLSSKGVLGWSPQTQGKAWLWSSRCWMAHVALDYVKLWKLRELRKGETSKVNGEAGEVEEQMWSAKWTRDLVKNSAYAPLTLHWSLESGAISQFWVGVCGSIAGLTSLRVLWKETAAL